MSAKSDAIDLLAFMESGMSMTAEQIAERWPEWSKLKDDAIARYQHDTEQYQRLFQSSALRRTTDPMVDSLTAAYYHWAYLPLIRQALMEEAGERHHAEVAAARRAYSEGEG